MTERVLRTFSGFPAGQTAMVTLPDIVFTELVPLIDDLLELRVTLLALRRLAQMRAEVAPWITAAELRDDPAMRAALGDGDTPLDAVLARAVARGTLLVARREVADGTVEHRYFANSPRGRAAVDALRRGVDLARAERIAARPNIFALYEQNIGPLTALLSEELKEAEATYPAAWVEEAFREAVSRNKRNWKYIHAILKRWQTEGKDEIHRRDRATDTQRYITGEYGDLIQH